MIAMQLAAPRTALRLVEMPRPEPGPGDVLIKVRACGVCRTDLHVVDGDLTQGKLPIIPGHEIVGTVVARGAAAERFAIGERVGVPWLGATCGRCGFCTTGRENLCDHARFTGYHLDGGYAEYAIAAERFCFALPAGYSDVDAAPLLCAGLIGYRSLVMAGDARRLGIYGFGAAAHIIVQVARHQGREVYAFTRPGDIEGQAFARSLGAAWASDSGTAPPEQLDAAIIFAPVGALLVAALRATVKGGTVVCAGIHMSDIPSFPYEILWGERTVRSVANLTRRDGEEFFRIAPQVPVRTATEPFPLAQANDALARLREGRITGAAVLVPSEAGTSPEPRRARHSSLITETQHMPYLTLPGCKLYYTIDDYTDAWTRPDTVLFVHGFTECTEAWRGWVPHFSRRYRVVRIDQRGFGQSGAVPKDFPLTTELYVDDLARLIRHVTDRPVHVVGGKSGGISVIMLAVAHPELTRTITVSCSPVTPPKAEGWIEEMERDGVRSWAKRTQRERMGSGMPEAGIEWWSDMMGQTAISTVHAYLQWVAGIDIREDLKRIQCPTLVIGTDTARRGRAVFEGWQKTIPRSELVILPIDGYHAAGTDPDATAGVTLDFIARYSTLK